MSPAIGVTVPAPCRLQEVRGEDEELDALRDGLADVIRHLDGVEEVADCVEPGEPPPDGRPPPSLDQLYQQRPVFVVTDDDEIPAYWLQQAIDEEMDNDDDLVSDLPASSNMEYTIKHRTQNF